MAGISWPVIHPTLFLILFYMLGISPGTPAPADAGLRKISIGPDEPEIYVVSEVDARLEAQQCRLERQCYIDGRSIVLQPGDVVVDAGANVGSFARMASLLAGPRGLVLALEPLPLVFSALQLNAKQHAHWARQQDLPAAPIMPLAYGLGSQVEKQVAFTFFPRCTALSTRYRNDTDAMESTSAIVINSINKHTERLFGQQVSQAQWIPWAALRRMYFAAHRLVFGMLYLSGAQQVTCHVTTLSHIIEEHGLRSISLLKVNVERSEEDILAGIKDEHWPIIKQVSMQAHHLECRLDRLEELLRRVGFAYVNRWQEPRFNGSSLWMLFASRLSPVDLTAPQVLH